MDRYKKLIEYMETEYGIKTVSQLTRIIEQLHLDISVFKYEPEKNKSEGGLKCEL